MTGTCCSQYSSPERQPFYLATLRTQAVAIDKVCARRQRIFQKIFQMASAAGHQPQT